MAENNDLFGKNYVLNTASSERKLLNKTSFKRKLSLPGDGAYSRRLVILETKVFGRMHCTGMLCLEFERKLTDRLRFLLHS